MTWNQNQTTWQIFKAYWHLPKTKVHDRCSKHNDIDPKPNYMTDVPSTMTWNQNQTTWQMFKAQWRNQNQATWQMFKAELMFSVSGVGGLLDFLYCAFLVHSVCWYCPPKTNYMSNVQSTRTWDQNQTTCSKQNDIKQIKWWWSNMAQQWQGTKNKLHGSV